MIDITGQQLQQALQKSEALYLLDVREPIEYHIFNIGGVNIPLGKLLLTIQQNNLTIGLHQTIVVICQRGLRSQTAKTILQHAGYTNVKNLLGGLIQLQKH
jgi:rhodanese-related sulfurtransferase